MLRKSITFAFLVCIVYIIVVGYLGLAVRDDYFALTFPSWPFLINCFEDCGYKIFIALCANGVLVGIVAFVLSSFVLYTLKLIRK